jgi:hypothetical protein
MILNHAIVSRATFKDKILRDKYYKISKEILIPAIKNQKETNFDWLILIAEEDVNYTKDYFEIDFIPIFDIPQFVEYIKTRNYTIQTRHDIDDWMSVDYISEIQNIYKNNIDIYDKFLIQAQPIRFNYNSKTKQKMTKYHDRNNSMFLTLCQKEYSNHILEEKHRYMWKRVSKVFTMPENYVEWVIHGNNISCNRKNFR